ncbi:MAG: hypothetical protein KDJ47_12990 [Hyphomicrobiaceae bacterium]|nr:hypothetical protein [Hyphomicrobiaceae bacterium]
MAGSAQLWPGPRMRAFLRSIISAEPGVDAHQADRIAERLGKRIARMLVWDASGSELTGPSAAQISEVEAAPAPPQAREEDAGEKAFDPFAFSVVVILKRQGRTAVMKRLEAITSIEQLHKIASAQHLGIDKSITAPGELREAIVMGAEQRLADRRAAAS